MAGGDTRSLDYSRWVFSTLGLQLDSSLNSSLKRFRA